MSSKSSLKSRHQTRFGGRNRHLAANEATATTVQGGNSETVEGIAQQYNDGDITKQEAIFLLKKLLSKYRQ